MTNTLRQRQPPDRDSRAGSACGLRPLEDKPITLHRKLACLAGHYRQQYSTIDVTAQGAGLSAVVAYTDPMFDRPLAARPAGSAPERVVVTGGENAGGRVALRTRTGRSASSAWAGVWGTGATSPRPLSREERG
jgi:hypothetical protein